jgi:hypothetical protein
MSNTFDAAAIARALVHDIRAFRCGQHAGDGNGNGQHWVTCDEDTTKVTVALQVAYAAGIGASEGGEKGPLGDTGKPPFESPGDAMSIVLDGLETAICVGRNSYDDERDGHLDEFLAAQAFRAIVDVGAGVLASAFASTVHSSDAAEATVRRWATTDDEPDEFGTEAVCHVLNRLDAVRADRDGMKAGWADAMRRLVSAIDERDEARKGRDAWTERAMAAESALYPANPDGHKSYRVEVCPKCMHPPHAGACGFHFNRNVEAHTCACSFAAPVVPSGTVPAPCGKTGPHVVNGVCPYCGEDPGLDEWSSHSEDECGSCGKGIMPVENDDGGWRFQGVYEDDGDEVFNPDGTRIRSGEAAGVPPTGKRERGT